MSAVVAVLAQPLLQVERLNADGGFVALTAGFAILAAAVGLVAGARDALVVIVREVVGAIADVLLMSHLHARASRKRPRSLPRRRRPQLGSCHHCRVTHHRCHPHGV